MYFMMYCPFRIEYYLVFRRRGIPGDIHESLLPLLRLQLCSNFSSFGKEFHKKTGRRTARDMERTRTAGASASRTARDMEIIFILY